MSTCWWWRLEQKQCTATTEAAVRRWQWALPAGCGAPLAVNVASLCRSRRRSLLMLGDSLTRQTFYALLQEAHAAGEWRPSSAECKGHDVDKRAPCATIACGSGRQSVRLCYRAAYHLTKSDVVLHSSSTSEVASTPMGRCCHYSSGAMGAVEEALPAVDDKPAWRHLLGGVDALMLNVGLHWVMH